VIGKFQFRSQSLNAIRPELHFDVVGRDHHLLNQQATMRSCSAGNNWSQTFSICSMAMHTLASSA
jgi:hypothetical protein